MFGACTVRNANEETKAAMKISTTLVIKVTVAVLGAIGYAYSGRYDQCERVDRSRGRDVHTLVMEHVPHLDLHAAAML